jgi:hypothetical protein
MATVAGEEPAHAQVHATGVQLLRGRKEACDCVCKINHLFAFLFLPSFFHVRKIQGL